MNTIRTVENAEAYQALQREASAAFDAHYAATVESLADSHTRAIYALRESAPADKYEKERAYQAAHAAWRDACTAHAVWRHAHPKYGFAAMEVARTRATG